MNTYKTSTGDRVAKCTIDSRIRQAKKKFLAMLLDRHGYFFCQASGKSAKCFYLDCSHIISVDRCQKIGKSELAYDVNNLQLESRSEHMKWENKEADCIRQKNFHVKMQYILKHDPEYYEILVDKFDIKKLKSA